MTVRTPSKEIRELDAETEDVESEASEMNESDQSNETDNEFDDNESIDEDEGNAGWADAFAKVLQQEKPKNKKYLVLSKAKKLAERETKTDADGKVSFEIVGEGKDDEDDEDVKPQIEDEIKPSSDELELAIQAQKERNNKLQELRVKPAAMDKTRERSFKRIATKGVVQLFNAVRAQQRDLVDRLEKAGSLDHKRDEVLNNINKRQFLDMLMGGKRAKSENVDNPVKDEKDPIDDSGRPSQWSVLRDDFMTNKKLASHWDNEDEQDDGAEQASNDSHMDSDGSDS